MQPLRAVLFDLWGTLIADDPVVTEERRLLRVEMARVALAELRFHYDAPDIETAFLAADEEHGRLHADERDFSTRGRTVAYMRHLDPALGGRLDERGWRLLDEAVLTPALILPPASMPGAAEALAAVKALGLPTALVSNAGTTPGRVLREILDGMGLLRHLDVTVFSDELEIAKPSPAIFAGALRGLGVPAAQAVFVGDQPRLDVLGALRAGMWSLQIGDLAADGITPHGRIGSLAELLPALRSLRLLE